MKLGQYCHFRNRKNYQVIGVAFDTATDSKVVLYQALYDCPELAKEYGANPVFTRPYDQFFGEVEHEGKMVPRFEYISE
jgi:hypothetical protein